MEHLATTEPCRCWTEELQGWPSMTTKVCPIVCHSWKLDPIEWDGSEAHHEVAISGFDGPRGLRLKKRMGGAKRLRNSSFLTRRLTRRSSPFSSMAPRAGLERKLSCWPPATPLLLSGVSGRNSCQACECMGGVLSWALCVHGCMIAQGLRVQEGCECMEALLVSWSGPAECTANALWPCSKEKKNDCATGSLIVTVPFSNLVPAQRGSGRSNFLLIM